MLWENMARRMRAIGHLLALTETGGVSNTAKSSYYRSGILLICTVVEGLVYELVKHSSANDGHVLWQIKNHTKKHQIPATVFGTAADLLICEPISKDVRINDDGVDFGKLNLYLKNRKLITPAEYRMLNNVRKERNRIHLQLMTTPDTGYTQNKVEMASKPLPFLVRKLKAAYGI